MIEAIMLSYSASKDEYEMTKRAIKSLLSSTAQEIHLVVVETHPDSHFYKEFGDINPFDEHDMSLVQPQKEFNYNEFLKIGYDALEKRSPYLLLLNNDIIVEDRCPDFLIEGLGLYDSVTPWCPGYHDRWTQPTEPYYVGTGTGYYLCGWAIMLRQAIFEVAPFEAFFPSEFKFWYQDNYYAFMLEKHKIQHALCSRARLRHLCSQSHKLIPPDKYSALTVGSEATYNNKLAEQDWNKEILLTVAISALSSRVRSHLPNVVDSLRAQAQGKPVEILCLLDNKKTKNGTKRNRLIEMAQGKYISFVDDDDRVADSYVDKILHGIKTNPGVDCITFNSWVTLDDKQGKICKFGFLEHSEDADAYYRPVNHICCIRKDIAASVKFKDVTWGDDNYWSFDIAPKLKSQYKIDETLYFYNFETGLSQSKEYDEHRQERNTYVPPKQLNPPASDLKIAVYAISKNEAANAKAFVESVREADYVIVGDTGSTDRTVDFLREEGATVYNLTVTPWRFDVARNATLSLVPSHVDVCIKLDLDERMKPGWRQAIEKHWIKNQTTRLWYWFNYTSTYRYQASWIHSRHGYYWRWPIHELLECSIQEQSVVVGEGLETEHHKDLYKSRASYLPLLEQAVKEDPCARTFFYLGREYFYAGMHEKVIETLEKYLEFQGTWNAERSAAMQHLASAYSACGKIPEAICYLERAHAEDLQSREALVDLAMLLHNAGKYELGYAYAKEALKIKDRPGHQFTNDYAWGVLPYDLASICAHHSGFKLEAALYLREAIRLSPDDARLRDNANHIVGTPNITFSIIIPTVGRHSLETTLCSILPQLGYWDEVLVVGDGPRPNAQAIVQRTRDPRVKYLEHFDERSSYGNAQRNYGISQAKESHIIFVDDDDILLTNAIPAIRAAAHCNKPMMFKLEYHGLTRYEIIWREKVFKPGNFGGPQLVIPNIPDMIAPWPLNPREPRLSDFEWVCAMAKIWGLENFEWRPEVIYKCASIGFGAW